MELGGITEVATVDYGADLEDIMDLTGDFSSDSSTDVGTWGWIELGLLLAVVVVCGLVALCNCLISCAESIARGGRALRPASSSPLELRLISSMSVPLNLYACLDEPETDPPTSMTDCASSISGTFELSELRVPGAYENTLLMA